MHIASAAGCTRVDACVQKSRKQLKSHLPLGANVNSVKFHETSLHHAARVSMVDMIELLVQFGAKVTASDNQGKKPVDYTTPASPAYTSLMFYESKLCLQYFSF